MKPKPEPITAQREAVRQEKCTELELRTRVLFASYGVCTLEEYNQLISYGRAERAVEVRLRDGRTMRMGVDATLSCLMRGAGTLVWEEQQ